MLHFDCIVQSLNKTTGLIVLSLNELALLVKTANVIHGHKCLLSCLISICIENTLVLDADMKTNKEIQGGKIIKRRK